MAADGSLKFDTGINTEGFKDGISTLLKAMEKLTDAVDKLSGYILKSFNGIGNGVDTVASKADEAAKGIDKISDASGRAEKNVEELKKQMDSIKVHRAEDTEYAPLPDRRTMVPADSMGYDQGAMDFIKNYGDAAEDTGRHINEFKQEIGNLEKKLKELESQGMYFGDDEYDEAYLKVSKVKQALSDYKKELLSPTPDAEIPVKLDTDSFEGQKQRLKQELADLEKQGITLGNPDYDSKYLELQKVLQAEKDYKKELLETDYAQKKVKKSSDSMKKSLDNAGKAGKKAGKSMSILGILGRTMLISFAMKAVAAVSNAVKEGMGNLAQYSGNANQTLSSLQSSLLYLKNSLAAGFEPILSIAVPAITALIDAVARAVSWLGHLTAALTGKGTYVRAKKTQEDYAASLKKTGGAAREAQKSLAAFDELNVFSQNSDNSGGGGAATDPSEMFETVEVSNELVEKLNTLKNVWGELKTTFSDGFSIGLGDTSSRLETIKSGINGIKDSLKNIFTDPQVVSASKKWGNTVVKDLGIIAGSVASVGLSIAANLIGGVDEYLSGDQDRIKQFLINMFDITGDISTIVANFSAAFAEIFSVFAGENGQAFTANLIGFLTAPFMGVTELFGRLGRDILNALLTPLTNNTEGFKLAFDSLLGITSQVMGDLRSIFADSFEKINQVYEADVKPMFDAFTEGLTELWGTVLEAVNTHILPAFQSLADKFSEFREQHMQPLIDKFLDLGGRVAEVVTTIWTNTLQPFLNWAVETFSPLIGSAIETVGGFFMALFETISDVASNILDALGGVLDFVEGVFTGDMDLALNGLSNIFKGVFNGIITLVEDTVNWISRGINKLSFDVPDWVPEIGGEHFGFNIEPISLPRLATGTVVPRQAGEFAAILGDNNRETEVVSPLSTIKQAVIEAMGEVAAAWGGGDINLTLELDGDVVYNTVIQRNRMQERITGRNPLLV